MPDRPLLCREDLLYCRRVAGVGRKPVDRLGRDGNNVALTEKAGGVFDVAWHTGIQFNHDPPL